jgi:superfamily II DNA or RNA helicase
MISKPDNSATKGRTKPRSAKLSHLHKPDDLSLEQWQIALRRQYGREQKFDLRNRGTDPVFSDFEITNPASGGVYRVAIRGQELGDNFCSCPDFKTNTLGTCKHIEFTLETIRQRRGGAAALQRGYQAPYSSVYLRYGAQRQVRFRAGTECPVEMRDLAEGYFDPNGALKPDAVERFDRFVAQASAIAHDLRCYDDALAFMAEVRDAAERRRILDKAFPLGANSPAFENLLAVPLYPYQREGALFAAEAGRSLIGDEMGLGKTIQAIGAGEIMAKYFGVERILVICPTSLKHQWQSEITKFSKRSAVVVAGLRAGREKAFAAASFYKITNYDTIRRDLDLIEAWAPDMVILDEAQRIKNWNTIAARCVKKIASPYAIVLTGTPLENRLEELVSVVQFVDRHRLGPTFEFLHRHQKHDPETGRVIGYQQLDVIGRTLQPILIRRRKNLVLKDLPERLDKTFFVPMTPQQTRHHSENRDVVARLVQKWRRHRYLSEADRQGLMIALQNMRMSCDSTYLLDHETDFGFKANELAVLLDEILEDPDQKVVIFSQWLRMHELLQRRLQDRPWTHVLFHGGVPGPKRKDLVDRFHEDKNCRAFLATDAGGVGLNLQHAASTVLNVDLPWNPAVLEQRIGRVHRLGQLHPVQVVNFVAKDTIEEGMLAVLRFKKSLFAGALDEGESTVLLGGTRLTKFIETVEQTTGAIPQPSTSAHDVAAEAAAEATEMNQAAQPGDDDIPANGKEPSGQSGSAAGRPRHGPEPTAKTSPPDQANPWAGLLQAGLSVLEELAAASRAAAPSQNSAKPSARHPVGASLLHQDQHTGESYMKIPVPSPEVLDQALGAIASLLERFRGPKA